MLGVKEKILSASGSISGTASILGSWQICHSVCLGIIALLSVMGVVVVGMPLLFLTKIAVPMWILAAVLFAITVGIYLKKKCISPAVLFLNAGLLIAGIPFQAVQSFAPYLWGVGGIVSSVSVVIFVKEKMKKKQEKKRNAGVCGSILLGVVLGISILALIYFATSSGQKAGTTGTTEAAAPETASGNKFVSIITGTTESGDVEIELIPQEVRDGKLMVKISANTHSVDLSPFDLTKITTLKYKETTILPVSAPALSGHHASGEIVFAVSGKMTEFTITIAGIPKTEKREYVWGGE
ncbi:hypothetical protein HZA99_00150 [Candidatus Woesearchaeota archaeon]|nr:hypothetical protein [Candidatus Woesearchaeota archaeon]